MSFLDDLRDKRQKFLDGLEANEEDINLDIFEDFYPDRAHFIYELLQNAEDAAASEVSFTLSKNSLVFQHDGRPFDKDDVRKITGIGVGTKRNDDDKIGRFGIGFKAVFIYTETPRIWSPTFAFEIADLVMPAELSRDPAIGQHTRFAFPFNSQKKSSLDAFSEIRAGLAEISDSTLLFLSRIESIHWLVEDGQEGRLLRIPHSDHHIEILREIDGKAAGSSHFLRFMQLVEGLENQYAAIAFEMEALPDVEASHPTKPTAERFRIVPAGPGRVAVYFTAAKETSGLRFHLHAPFVPELSRASVQETPANEPLFRQLAGLCAESLFAIRDLGLLDRDFLAVLPNPNDEISARYECLRDTIVDAMNEQPLTPTHSGRHAPARQLLQAGAGLKALLNGEDIRVLTDSEASRDWAVGATQINNPVDRFLRGLDIKKWDIEQFVKVLKARLDTNGRFDPRNYKWLDGPDNKLLAWLRPKTDKWHQVMYALLYRDLKHSTDQLETLCIVRLSIGEYRAGTECYFPTEDVQEDSALPRVATGIYASGRNKAERVDARSFLEAVGVREVGEYELVEAILKRRYTKDAKVPSNRMYEKDLRRFISLVQDNPRTAQVFSNYWIFEREDAKWACPGQVYLDSPYIDTGLHAFYRRSNDDEQDDRPVALADRYLKIRISREALADFAKTTGVQSRLSIERQSTDSHPNADRLRQDYYRRGARWTHTAIDTDWTIPDLKSLLENTTETLSRLIWKTMTEADQKVLTARFRPNQQYSIRKEPSTLVLVLRELSWLPQKGGAFVRPAEASQDLFPEGFAFDAGWLWIDAVGFGEESAKRVEERRNRQKLANELGFDDDEALDDARRFAELSPETRQRILKEHECPADLPREEPGDPERRAEAVREQAWDAPERTTEKRPRSVSVNRDEVKEDARTYLHNLYTNPDGVMICQICKDALPFKLPDGNYYFETVEFLPELEKGHYQNYLSLCPNHAAMYQHANGSKDSIKDRFVGLEGNEMEVTLAGDDTTIYFTGTHIADLRAVVEAEGGSS